MIKKFRVWSDYHKEFLIQGAEFGLQRLFEDFSVALMGKWQRNEDYKMPFRISDYKIQQWTGLTDSQGVEIYEGDILEQEHDYIETPIQKWTGVVEFYSDNASENGWRIKTPYDFGLKIHHTAKTIGNIFQTPEILEKCSK